MKNVSVRENLTPIQQSSMSLENIIEAQLEKQFANACEMKRGVNC